MGQVALSVRLCYDPRVMEQAEYHVMAAVEPTHWWYRGMRTISAAWLDQTVFQKKIQVGPQPSLQTGLAHTSHRDWRILDAGCGSGGNARFLQRYGTVVALDYAPEALSLAQAHLPDPPDTVPEAPTPVMLTRGSVMELPYADNSLDLVTSFDVLYHRGVADEMAALQEVSRVLRAGGYLLMRLPAYNALYSKHDRAVHTRRRYVASEVRQLVEGAGFVVERLSYINTLLFPIALAQRVLERLLPALEQHDSDLSLPSEPLNNALRFPMAVEAAWLGLGGTFPVGLSILCLARSRKSVS